MSQAVGAKYWENQDLSAGLVAGPALMTPYNGHVWAHFTWAGAPTGTFSLQCRTASSGWSDVPGAAAGFPSQPAGAPQVTPIVVNFVNMPGTEFRFVYTGAGAGTATVFVGFGDVQET